jgi:hypothetical protein
VTLLGSLLTLTVGRRPEITHEAIPATEQALPTVA